MAQVLAADKLYVPGLWLTGAEWASGYALPWFLDGWTRHGLTNVPMVSKRDEIDPIASILNSTSRSRFQAVHAGELLSG